MQLKRCYNAGYVGSRGLPAIKRHRCRKIGEPDSHHVGNPSPKTETDYTDLAIAVFMIAQVFKSGYKIFQHFIPIPFALQGASVVVIARVTTQWAQGIRCQAYESLEAGPSRYIFAMRIKSPVLVHNYDAAEFFPVVFRHT